MYFTYGEINKICFLTSIIYKNDEDFWTLSGDSQLEPRTSLWERVMWKFRHLFSIGLSIFSWPCWGATNLLFYWCSAASRDTRTCLAEAVCNSWTQDWQLQPTVSTGQCSKLPDFCGLTLQFLVWHPVLSTCNTQQPYSPYHPVSWHMQNLLYADLTWSHMFSPIAYHAFPSSLFVWDINAPSIIPNNSWRPCSVLIQSLEDVFPASEFLEA